MRLPVTSLLVAGLSVLASCKSKDLENFVTPPPTLETTTFGTTPDGKAVKLFTLKNDKGIEAKISEYGATLVSLKIPDRDGKVEEITIGYGDDFEGWLQNSGYFGATVGRFGNRIAGGKFNLSGKEFTLATNNEPGGIPCSLHGGIRGFDKVVWSGEITETEETVGVKLTYRSVEGEEGYPGNLDVTVTYSLSKSSEMTKDGDLSFFVEAVTDAPTPVNIINHAYWNLTGDPGKSILDLELQLLADDYLPTNLGLIPTGEIAPVAGTPMDFTAPTVVGSRIDEKTEALEFGGGYDHCWVLRHGSKNGAIRTAAILRDPESGRVMEVQTDQPGVQFYTGNFLDGDPSGYRTGLCLETQCFPDSPNNPSFPKCILYPGENYHHRLVWRFSAE